MANKNERITEDEYAEITAEKKLPTLKGFDEEAASKLHPLMEKFIGAYAENTDVADGSWIDEQLKSELPDKSDEEILAIREEIRKSVQSWDENMKSLDEACAQGQTKEEWLEGKLQEASAGVSVEDYGNGLALTSAALHQENQRAVGQIDGFPAGKEEGEAIPEAAEWTAGNTHELALQISKEVEVGNLASTVLGTGWKLAEKLPVSEKLVGLKQVADALRSGDDQGVKEAASAALKTGIEKGYIPILPKSTPTSVVSSIACFGVEQAKVMVKFADGEIRRW